MKDFEEWAKSSLPKWSDKLLALGASWDSFRREPADDVIADLVKGGIPLLSAKDIVEKARLIIQRKSAPMAIFWDFVTLSIPTSKDIAPRDVIVRVKSELSSYGVLKQFRGYGGNTSASISEQQRSIMIELGCSIIDSPHGAKNDIATKRIIMDAMKFAYEHPDGATLCFITGDSDLTYLLACLERPQWATVLITNETTMKRMTGNSVLCDVKLKWEADILQSKSMTKSPSPDKNSDGLAAAAKSLDSAKTVNGSSTTAQRTPNDNSAKKLSHADVTLLQSQIEASAIDLGNGQKHSALKSRVGSLLRLAEPERFPTREDLTVFLSDAVDDGLVVETGFGEYKILTLVMYEGKPTTPPLEIKKISPPITNKELPKKVVDLSHSRPYVIFVPWSECVNRETFPKRAFVHTSNKWAMLMFETLIQAQQAAVEFPWLSKGDLLDWRRVGNDKYNSPNKPVVSPSSVPARSTESYHSKKASYDSRAYHHHDSRYHHGDHQHDAAVSAVIGVMRMLLKSDEIYVAEPVLRYQLAARENGNTADKQYYYWIEKAVGAGVILSFRRPGVPKGRFYCLPDQLENSRAACNPVEIDTTEEENHILNNILAKASNHCVTRIEVIDSLKSTFSRMNSSSMRVRVFQNGARKNLFFVAKDGSTQIVARTKTEAQEALKLLVNPTGGESAPKTVDGGGGKSPVADEAQSHTSDKANTKQESST